MDGFTSKPRPPSPMVFPAALKRGVRMRSSTDSMSLKRPLVWSLALSSLSLAFWVEERLYTLVSYASPASASPFHFQAPAASAVSALTQNRPSMNARMMKPPKSLPKCVMRFLLDHLILYRQILQNDKMPVEADI